MVDFIDQYRDQHGVEPICKELPIAPSTYRRCKALERQPEKRGERTTVALCPPGRRPAGRDRLVQMGLHAPASDSAHQLDTIKGEKSP